MDGVEPPEGMDYHHIDYASVDSGFFRAAGVPLLDGREFQDRDDADAPPVAIVSRSFAERFFPEGNAVGQIVRYYLFQNRSVHLLHKVRFIDIVEPGRADVVVLVAVAGSPIEGIEQIGQMQADLLRFDIRMIEEEKGEWRLAGSAWERATATDFL